MKHLKALPMAAAALLAPTFALAQEVADAVTVADAPLAGGWQVAFAILAVAMVPLLALIGWAIKRLIDFIGIKVENETVRGILQRLSGSVNDAVAKVGQTVKAEIEKARATDSPGGAQITAEEAENLKRAVWDLLKREYGGFDQLFGLLQKIGIGDSVAATEKIDTMIEAAVAGQKAARPGPR